MNIFFLGNSFTFYNEMPQMFSLLARNNGKDVHVFSVTKGGRKLYESLDNDDIYTKNFNEEINSRKYDFVFLQDQSFEPIVEPLRFADSVKRLCELLKDKTEKIVLYETWGYDKDSKKLAEHGWKDIEMSKMLTAAYKKAADENGLMLSPVGQNFLKIYTKTDIDLYSNDRKHPSYAGSALAALTHYYTVFGEFPENTEGILLQAEEIARFKKVILGENDLLYINQLDYPDIPYITRTELEDADYGKTTTIATSGCALCSSIMAAHKLLGKCDMTLTEAVELSYSVNANHNIGTAYTRFAPAFAEKMGLNYEFTDDPDKLIACLKSGGVAIIRCRTNPEAGYRAVFTDKGHCICAIGVLPDGRVQVLDPSYKEGKYDEPERKGKVEVMDGFIAVCDVKVLVEDSYIKKPKSFCLYTKKEQ